MGLIHAKERRLLEVFADEYAFSIPSYQRPYSWEEEHTGALLDDVLTASGDFTLGAKNDSVEPYFLGSVVLVKHNDAKPDAQVIDGQQRLTTLVLLLAALRDLAPEQHKADLGHLIFESGSELLGTRDRCRVTLRRLDHEFFETNVLRSISLDRLQDLKSKRLNDPQRRLVTNALLLLERLRKVTPARRVELAAYLLQHVFLVVVSTPSVESAFRIFSVLNDRGLDLTIADILKAEVTGSIADSDQADYVAKWEAAEDRLGTQRFADLFGHIRMIHGRNKLRKSTLAGFREDVRPQESPAAFVDEWLVPASDALAVLKEATYACTDRAIEKRINAHLHLLRRMDDEDWVPPAIRFLMRHGDRPAAVEAFLRDLERLSSGLWLLRRDVNQRIDRHGKLLASIEAGEELQESTSPLQLSADERLEIARVLDENVFELSPKKKRTMVLLRLDGALSSGEAVYEFDRVTVEHVLPQTPPTDSSSKWLQWWPDPDLWMNSVHRLGNLALLNRNQNSAARNWEFDRKKESYFRGRTGTSPFAITTEVLRESEWTPEVFAERQDRLHAKLVDVWRLH